MLTLLTTFVFTFAIPTLLIVMGFFAREIKTPRATRIISNSELEEARRYATMFGLTNDADIDVVSILEMGRKYEAFIGSDKVDEIVSLAGSAMPETYSPGYYFESRAEHHVFNNMIKVQDLVAVSHHNSFIASLIRALGGDKNDEPTSL